MGNHEQMFLKSLDDVSEKVNWIRNGGRKTLDSFLVSEPKRIPEQYFDFIKTFKYYEIVEDCIFVHAGLNMNIDNPFSDKQTILWERDLHKFFNKKWLGNRFLVHGHTPMNRESIINQLKGKSNVICIDNGTFLSDRDGYGSITIFDINNKKLIFSK